MARTVRVALIGLGNVGRAFLGLMSEKRDVLARHYGVELVLTGAADSKAAVLNANGIDHEALGAHKTGGQTLTTFPNAVPGLGVCQMAERVEADVVLGAAAVNLRTGQPGLESTLMALGRGISVVLADKGPLVHAYTELQAAAQEHGAQLAFSATVCGALPVVNIGQRDLAACRFHRVRGIFNSTSNYILDAMRRGESYDDALRQAQEEGVAEADPTLDVEGWDTANKLVIIANAILGQSCTLTDVGTSTRDHEPRSGRGRCPRPAGRDRAVDRAGGPRTGIYGVRVVGATRMASGRRFSRRGAGLGDGDCLRDRYHGRATVQGGRAWARPHRSRDAAGSVADRW